MNCCLCLNVTGERVPATVTLQGYSVCDTHGLESSWMRSIDDTLNLPATVRRLRGIAARANPL